MQRAVVPSKKEGELTYGIEAERKSVALPTSTYLFGIFPSLTASDLMRMKRVSRNFRLLLDTYIGQTAGQIFYAVSPSCQVEIGTRTMSGAFVTDNINRSVSGSKLIHTFKYEWDTSLGMRPNGSMWVFRTEIEALNFLTPPRAPTQTIVYLSAKTGLGMELLKNLIKEKVGFQASSEGTFSARRRHLDALERAKNFFTKRPNTT